MVPEDRMAQGLVPDFEIWRNTTLPALSGVSVLNALPVAERERERGWEAIRLLSIKASSPDILVNELSGGNAQKVTIAKWLFSDVKLFLLDEPTAGIDIGAKTDILRLVRQLASEGKSVIIVSSEFEELLAVADRIIVMRDGQCVAERDAHETSEHELLLLAGGQGASLEASTPLTGTHRESENRVMTTLTQNPVERTDEASKVGKSRRKPIGDDCSACRERGVYYALLLLIIVLAIITTYLGQANYLSVLNLSNVVYQSSLMAIMAVAMTVVLISGNFDLSVASVAALAAVLLIGNADAIGFFPAAASLGWSQWASGF